MALKAVIDSLDQVAEAFRPEYTSKDGKFVLAIEGAPAGFVPASELATANGKLTEFRDNNIALLKEVDTLKPVKTEFEAFKVKYDGIDPAEVVTLKAKVAEEQRYLALLARADKIEDILRIDQVLAQVRTQVEQLTAQLNSIKARTTFSTITVQVIPLLAEPPVDPLAYDPSRTLERAFAALSSVLRVAADAFIWALVFGWLPLTLLGLAMLVARSRSRIVPSA